MDDDNLDNLDDLAVAPDSAQKPERDRSLRELIGKVREIIYRSSGEGAFTVVALDSEDVAVGSDPYGDVRAGILYRFLGCWTEHPKYGPRFSFDTFVRHIPHDYEGVVTYLKKTAPHIGPGIAERLWNAYGSDAVTMLRTRPNDVASAGIMPLRYALEAADALQTLAGMENLRIDLWTIIANRGFPRTLVDDLILRWGSRALDRIRRDPFSLMIADLPGCGFKRCDALYLDQGHSPYRLKRQTLCCWNILNDLASEGHTWAQVERVSRGLQATIRKNARPRDAIRMGIRARWIARRRDPNGQLWLAVAKNAKHEETIAERVHALLDWHPRTAEELAADRQRMAAAYAEMEWDDP